MLRIDLVFRCPDQEQLLQHLTRLEARLGEKLAAGFEALQRQGEQILATQAEFDAILLRIDAATSKGATLATQIADELKTLRGQISAGGLSADQETAIAARLGTLASATEGLSAFLQATANKENPVPTPPPPLP